MATTQLGVTEEPVDNSAEVLTPQTMDLPLVAANAAVTEVPEETGETPVVTPVTNNPVETPVETPAITEVTPSFVSEDLAESYTGRGGVKGNNTYLAEDATFQGPLTTEQALADIEATKAAVETAKLEYEELRKARKEETERVRQIMNSNVEDPNAFLEDAGLLQQYTLDNSFIKDAQGNILYKKGTDGKPILDSNGNKVPEGEDVSLSMDPRYYQLEASNAAALVKAGTITAGEATQAAVSNFEGTVQTISGLAQNLAKVAALEPMKAASMSSKLNSMLDGMEEGVIPLWARPAVTKVEQALAGRGLSASSIGRDSLFNAIIQAAMPIAQQDAAFEQDANKTVYTSKVQAIFEDTKIEFASAQFNAKSANDSAQFKAQLETQVALQNAARSDTMAQFNADSLNKGEQFNASEGNRMAQFNATMETQRDQFNKTMDAKIDSASVNWRRGMNSQNTAGINAVNQANTQQAFNLSNQALSNLWQEQRDLAHWMFQADEKEKDRRAQIEATVLARESSTASEIGGFIEGLDFDFNDIKTGVTDAWDWVDQTFLGGL